MKKTKFIKNLFTGVLATMLLTSCNVNEESTDLVPFEITGVENPETISQHIIDNPNLSILEEALRLLEEDPDTRFLSNLNTPGSNTIFAPTNEAFTSLLSASGASEISDIPLDQLTELILTHIIVDQNLPISDLNNIYFQVPTTKTLNERAAGTRERIRGTFNLNLHINGSLFNGTQNNITSSIEANNGVLHLIDNIIRPSTAVDLFTENPDYSTFFRAIEILENIEGSTLNITSVLTDLEVSYTLFLPDNNAFEKLFLELDPSGGITSVEQMNARDLLFIVAYHVTGPFTRVIDTDATESMPITVRDSNASTDSELTFDGFLRTITDENNRVANIGTLFNIHGLNGVVHTIDTVLLPIIPEPVIIVTEEEEVQ